MLNVGGLLKYKTMGKIEVCFIKHIKLLSLFDFLKL